MREITHGYVPSPTQDISEKKFARNFEAAKPAFADVWRRRIKAEEAVGNLTRAYRDVLLVMPTFRGHGGEMFPSHDAIGARAKCSARTVQRALNLGRDLGLVHWMPRRKRVGWRMLRTSNRYLLNVPTAPVVPGQRPPFPRRPTNGQAVRVQVQVSKKEALQGMFAEAQAVGRDLLAERLATMEARFRGIACQRR